MTADKADIVVHTLEQMFRRLDEVRKNAPPLEPLWGYFLFRKAVTSIVGDPGVCKTTFGYGLGMALCNSHPFLGIYAEEPAKLLYMDFESADSLIASRASLISDEQAPDFWLFNIVDYYLNHIFDHTSKFCAEHNINLIFIDNQSMAFNTRDENDNAEAIKQMRMLRQLANITKASVVIFHHTSKGNLPGTRKGTGAYARARLADICINIDMPSEDDKDIVRLETVKNRLVDERTLWYLKKVKGQFEFTDPPLGVSGVQTDTKIYAAQRALLEFMQHSIEYEYGQLVTTLSNNGIDQFTVGNAIDKLVQQRKLIKPKRGFYMRKQIVK